MKMIRFAAGPVRANCYILYNGSDALVIDPGGNQMRILKEAEDLGVTIRYVLLTHGHFDHAGAAACLQRAGAEVYVHALDADKLYTDGNLGADMGFDFEKFHADKLLYDGDRLNLCGYDILVLHTPGHTAGSVCFVIEDCIFSGDTLFKGSIGRTDLGDGDLKALENSIRTKLYTLDGDYKLYPGHLGESTLRYEKNYNLFVPF